MTAVATTYLANAKIGFGLPLPVANAISTAVAILSLITFLLKFGNWQQPLSETDKDIINA